MKIAILITLITALLILSRQKKKVYFHNTLTSLFLFLAIIQAPIYYFYTSGFETLFGSVCYSAVGLGFSIWLLFKFKIDLTVKTKYHVYGIYVAISLGILSFFWGWTVVEQIDWKLRRKAREEIVLDANKFKSGIHTYKPQKWNSLPISNGGNEVIINKEMNGGLTVTFYTDRGFIDHYSAFVYTNDPKMEKEYENSSYAKKLDKNWFNISR